MLSHLEQKSDLYINCSHVNTMSDNFEVDSGKNSDEGSTGVDTTFSCEKCGQTFKSRQELKKDSSVAH
jgi:hypothetical protein